MLGLLLRKLPSPLRALVLFILGGILVFAGLQLHHKTLWAPLLTGVLFLAVGVYTLIRPKRLRG